MILWSSEEELSIGVEQWAEIRRLYFVEKRSKRAIHRLTGVHRDMITRAVGSDEPPRYERKPAGSKLDSFKEWVCEQLRAARLDENEERRAIRSHARSA